MKYDVKREHKDLYAPRNTTWTLLDVPELTYLAVDGRGDPNTSPAYAAAVEALYAVAYTLKFATRQETGDFVVGPLEGLWWHEDPTVFTARAKESWNWTMLLHLPDWARGISPFWWVPDTLTGDVHAGHVVGLCVVAVVLVLIALVGFRRRDIPQV